MGYVRKESRKRRLLRSRFGYEQLEKRCVLANITVTDAFLVDFTGVNELTDPIIGQEFGVRVQWQTTNLPANIESYQVEYRVNGQALRSAELTAGAGMPTYSGIWWWQGGWYATPGEIDVEVIVDVDNEVVEDDETDNTINFQFTPTSATDLPQKFVWPLPTEPFTESVLWNYNDVDTSSNFLDWANGPATYNGHNGIDTGPRMVSGMDGNGIPMLAAANGTVIALNDGEFDRQEVIAGQPANFVILDHGNGWQTWYYHMRRDSVQVRVGDFVSQGDLLGLVGSSGSSSAPHIHFQVMRGNTPVETFHDPETFWLDPPEYVHNEKYVLESGITNYNPTDHFWEGPVGHTGPGSESQPNHLYQGLFFID